jgi:hypothetical protein
MGYSNIHLQLQINDLNNKIKKITVSSNSEGLFNLEQYAIIKDYDIILIASKNNNTNGTKI